MKPLQSYATSVPATLAMWFEKNLLQRLQSLKSFATHLIKRPTNCLAILIQMSCASAPRSRSQPLTAFIFPSIWPSIPSARNAGAGSRANIKTIAAIAVRLFHGITLIMLKSLSLINPFPPRIHSNLCGSVFCPCSGRKQLVLGRRRCCDDRFVPLFCLLHLDYPFETINKARFPMHEYPGAAPDCATISFYDGCCSP